MGEHSKWEAIILNLQQMETLHAGLASNSMSIADLEMALRNVEAMAKNFSELYRATVIGTLNMIVAMIENLQRNTNKEE